MPTPVRGPDPPLPKWSSYVFETSAGSGDASMPFAVTWGSELVSSAPPAGSRRTMRWSDPAHALSCLGWLAGKPTLAAALTSRTTVELTWTGSKRRLQRAWDSWRGARDKEWATLLGTLVAKRLVARSDIPLPLRNAAPLRVSVTDERKVRNDPLPDLTRRPKGPLRP